MITSSQVGVNSPSSGRSMEIVMLSCLIDSNISIVFLVRHKTMQYFRNNVHTFFIIIDHKKVSKSEIIASSIMYEAVFSFAVSSRHTIILHNDYI